MPLRLGTSSDASCCGEVLARSGTNCASSGTLLRGGFRGRVVSVLMIRCDALRWLNAEITWGALNAGLRGT